MECPLGKSPTDQRERKNKNFLVDKQKPKTHPWYHQNLTLFHHSSPEYSFKHHWKTPQSIQIQKTTNCFLPVEDFHNNQTHKAFYIVHICDKTGDITHTRAIPIPTRGIRHWSIPTRLQHQLPHAQNPPLNQENTRCVSKQSPDSPRACAEIINTTPCRGTGNYHLYISPSSHHATERTPQTALDTSATTPSITPPQQ